MSIKSFFQTLNIAKLKANRDVKKLVKALNHKDNSIQKDAMEALEEIGDPTFVQPFLRILKDLYKGLYETESKLTAGLSIGQVLRKSTSVRDKYETERKKALWALETIGNRKSIDMLIKEIRKNLTEMEKEGKKMMMTSEEWQKKFSEWRNPTWALERLGEKAEKEILNLCENRNEAAKVRTSLMMVLANRKTYSAVESLIKIALDKSEEQIIRKEAISRLAEFGNDSKIIASLKLLRADTDKGIKKKAIEVLKKIDRLR